MSEAKKSESKLELKPDISKMEYRYLGNSGLRVSVLGFGNAVNYRNDKTTVESIKTALSLGINYFDTAEIYGLGTGETNLGKAMKELGIARKKVVISTKIFKIGNDPNDCFLSRKHIVEGLKNSLQRLQLKYVDIVYCHRFDSNTPLEEVCDSMNYIIDQGLAFYWGTSGWTASQIMETYAICDKLGLIRPICEQTHYNVFTRSPVEDEYNDLIKKYKLGLVTNPDVNCCLFGASKATQIEDNVKALDIYKKIDKDTFIEIEKIMDNAPTGEMDYLTFTQLPSRRNVAMNIDYLKH